MYIVQLTFIQEEMYLIFIESDDQIHSTEIIKSTNNKWYKLSVREKSHIITIHRKVVLIYNIEFTQFILAELHSTYSNPANWIKTTISQQTQNQFFYHQ